MARLYLTFHQKNLKSFCSCSTSERGDRRHVWVEMTDSEASCTFHFMNEPAFLLFASDVALAERLVRKSQSDRKKREGGDD